MSARDLLARLRPLVIGAGLIGGVLVGAGSLVLERTAAREVLMIVPWDAKTQELNRTLWSKGEPVAPIYGQPFGSKTTVFFISDSRLVKPVEDPSITLLPVNKQAGDNPLQLKTFRLLTRSVAAGLIGLGLLGFVFPRRRSPDVAG